MENPSEIRDSEGKRRYDVVDKLKQEALRNFIPNRNTDLLIPSPIDDEKAIRAQQCVQESVIAGTKAAAIAFVASAVPTNDQQCVCVGWSRDLPLGLPMEFVAVRTFPWAKTYVKLPQQAMIIACATAATFYFSADKALVKCARKNAAHRPS